MARWSQLKQKIEERFCPALKGRVEPRSTRYPKSAEPWFHGGGRGYITLDGAEIFNMATHSHLHQLLDLQRESSATQSRDRYDYAIEHMGVEGKYTQFTFYHALDQYLSLSIEKALDSSDVLIRALALIDRRLGKRRFVRLPVPGETEHELVRRFYDLRAQAEGWRRSDGAVA